MHADVTIGTDDVIAVKFLKMNSTIPIINSQFV
jgi:hypothetical protein